MFARSHSSKLTLLLFLVCLVFADAWSRKAKEEEQAEVLQAEGSNAHFLIQLIGHEIYSVLKKPKYKFLIYMTVGKLPSEENTILILSTVCNLLYGIAIWFGFMWVSRERMLLITLVTLYVGPAIILILLGLTGMSLAAFALYPTASVLAMFTWFFLTSQLAQILGRRLGLDSDGDGDVDFLDLLHFFASTKVGKFLGLRILYEALDSACKDPFQEINRRLDSLTKQMQSNEEALVRASSRSFGSPVSITSERGEI